MSDPSFDAFTDAYAREIEKVSLQDHIYSYMKNIKPLPLPRLAFHFTDLHGSIGDEHDPLTGSKKEPGVLDMLGHFLDLGYTWMASEIWDMWRAFDDLMKAYEAHPELIKLVMAFQKAGLLQWTEGNHERPLLILPKVQLFEGYGKKVIHYHGALGDGPNDEYWWAGRAIVRLADKLGIDPESSPHPANADRHAAVRQMVQDFCDANPGYDVLWGHSHWPEQPVRYKVVNHLDPERIGYYINPDQFTEAVMEKVGELQNSHNPGSPISGTINITLIEEGVITPKEWN